MSDHPAEQPEHETRRHRRARATPPTAREGEAVVEGITVASIAPMAVQIFRIDPEQDPAQPGLHPPTEGMVLYGTGHPDALGGYGITEGVPRDMFEAWMTQYPHFDGVLREVPAEEAEAMEQSSAIYGHEPLLEEAATGDEAALAAKGSMVTKDAPIDAEDQAAHSNTPFDGSPASQHPVGWVIPPRAPLPELRKG